MAGLAQDQFTPIGKHRLAALEAGSHRGLRHDEIQLTHELLRLYDIVNIGP